VRVFFILDGQKIIKWQGRIPKDGINPIPGLNGERYTSVTVKDWIYRASNHKLRSIAYTTNKTLNQGVALVLADMSDTPDAVDYRTPESTFPTIFDTMTSQTTALSEIAKLTQSEIGYTYLTRYGLRVEGRLTRNEEKTSLDEYPMARSQMECTVNEDGDELVNEDGDCLLYADATSAFFDNTQLGMELSYGMQFYNQVKYTAYPRRVDASATTVLYSLQSPMFIASGQSVVISGSYKDPTGVAKSVNGIDMVTPVATTHYKMYANQDGTGTNLTANLTVTPDFPNQASFRHTFTNSGASGYITFFNQVGLTVTFHRWYRQ